MSNVGRTAIQTRHARQPADGHGVIRQQKAPAKIHHPKPILALDKSYCATHDLGSCPSSNTHQARHAQFQVPTLPRPICTLYRHLLPLHPESTPHPRRSGRQPSNATSFMAFTPVNSSTYREITSTSTQPFKPAIKLLRLLTILRPDRYVPSFLRKPCMPDHNYHSICPQLYLELRRSSLDAGPSSSQLLFSIWWHALARLGRVASCSRHSRKGYPTEHGKSR